MSDHPDNLPMIITVGEFTALQDRPDAAALVNKIAAQGRKNTTPKELEELLRVRRPLHAWQYRTPEESGAASDSGAIADRADVRVFGPPSTPEQITTRPPGFLRQYATVEELGNAGPLTAADWAAIRGAAIPSPAQAPDTD